MTASKLIKQLRERRRKLEITQKDLGNKVNLSNSYISLLERNKRSIRLEDFASICEELGLEITMEEKDNDQTREPK